MRLEPARRDIERNRRRVRYVEALDRAGQGEPGDVVAGLLGQLPQALAFGAEHERQRPPQRQPGEVVVAAGIEADTLRY